MRSWRRTIEGVLCALGLGIVSACGGGGGGSAVTMPVRPTPFTSWSATAPNTAVVAEGISQSAPDTFTVGGLSGHVTVTSVGAFSAVEDSSAVLSFDASRELRSLSVSTPSASASWSTATPGDTVVCNAGLCTAANSTGSGIVANPYDPGMGWNYQTFGVWTYETNGGVGFRNGNIGAISVGARTPVGALPTIGTAVYSGLAAGLYIDSAGVPFLTAASMSANVNFGTRSVQLSTTGTNLTNLNTSALSSDPGLNLSGALSYLSGSNRFSGNVTTASGALTGTATGSFYGPFAEEIGGIYSLTGTGPEAMTGGFGGKQ